MWSPFALFVVWLLAYLLAFGNPLSSQGPKVTNGLVSFVVGLIEAAGNRPGAASQDAAGGAGSATPFPGAPPFTVVARLPPRSDGFALTPTLPPNSDAPDVEATSTPSGPNPTLEPTLVATPGAGPRYDDPVLRWLPEVRMTRDETGVPVALLLAIIQVGSGGNPNLIGPYDTRGLLQVLPDEFESLGLPESEWHRPQDNLLAGARLLAIDRSSTDGWKITIRRYAARWCGGDFTCQDSYADAIYAWRDHYRALLADPVDLVALPAYWLPPTIAPTPGPLVPLTFPNSTDFPTAVASPEETPTGATSPGPDKTPAATSTSEPESSPTAIATLGNGPTSPPDVATATPTLLPLETPLGA